MTICGAKQSPSPTGPVLPINHQRCGFPGGSENRALRAQIPLFCPSFFPCWLPRRAAGLQAQRLRSQVLSPLPEAGLCSPHGARPHLVCVDLCSVCSGQQASPPPVSSHKIAPLPLCLQSVAIFCFALKFITI